MSREEDPFLVAPKVAVDFLQEFSKSNSKFGNFNLHRSALSVAPPGDIRTDSVIKRFFKGISR